MLAAILLSCFAAPDVYLISVDTLRADRLSCYGYEFPTTPHIDALAEKGIVYEDMLCEVPLTGPSMGAMMASRTPRVTGAVRNGVAMPEDIPLVAERFKEAGYATWCVQSNWTLKSDMSGLHRGFDDYDQDFKKRRWGFLVAEREGDKVLELALDRIQNRASDEPVFAWIHFSDPHAPYKWRRKHNVQDVNRRDLDKTEDIRARYDSEVHYTDSLIGELLEALPKENAIIVFVGDHGESLMEHGYLGHGRRLNQTGLHIPFIVHGPGITPGRSNAPVRGIDVGPTILGLAGLAPWPTMLGVNLAQDTPPMDRVRVVETYGGAAIVPGAKQAMAEADAIWQGVIADEWKFMHDNSGTWLYNLADDPGELNNLADEDSDRVDQLRSIMDQWLAENPRRANEGKALTDEDIEALENLGYL